MDRRKFLAAAAVASSSSLLSAAEAVQQTHSGAHTSAHSASFELDEISVSQLRARLLDRSLSCEQLAELYLQRMEAVDSSGPALRSVIEVNPDALPIAKSLDAELRQKGPRGPLHGIPILLKDNIETGDKMQTTAGSLALLGDPATRDSFVAERLRAAGAVVLGKTNLSEWANWRSTHSTSGWSGRGGQTKNPYALDRNPCGSSSGSGAAVSANLCAAAIGSETDGSVVCPASMCGIVGIKPTLGLVSRAGIVPIAHSQDTAGPMARSVSDAALLLGALVGVDTRDSATQESAGRSYNDYSQFLDAKGLRGARIGVARQYMNMGPAMTAIMEDCLRVMKEAGAVIVDPADFSTFEAWRETETEVLLYEFKADLNAYLAGRGAKVKTLEDCIRFNREHARQEMPYFKQELMEQSQAKGPLTEKAYKEALAKNHRLTRKEGIDAVIAKHKLDAIVGPTAGPAWLTDWVGGDRADSGCSSPAAVAGYPHITVPAGFTFGLTIGISFFGGAWSEPTLLKLAYAFEQASHARRKPEFLRTVAYAS